MSNQRERLIKSIGTSGDGHAVKQSQAEAEQVTAPEQATGLPLSPVRRLAPGKIKTSKKNKAAFAPLSLPEFDRLKADIEERGVLVPLILKADKTLIAGHNRLNAVNALNRERKKKGEPPLTVPVQYVETELLPKAEKAFVIKDNLLRRQLTPETTAQLLAQLYPEVFNSTGKGKRKKDTVSLLDVASEVGIPEKKVKRAKETHQRAKAIADKSGKTAPDREDYEKATAEKNAQRRAKASAKPLSDSTGTPQGAPKGKGRGQDIEALENALRGIKKANKAEARTILEQWLKKETDNEQAKR